MGARGGGRGWRSAGGAVNKRVQVDPTENRYSSMKVGAQGGGGGDKKRLQAGGDACLT